MKKIFIILFITPLLLTGQPQGKIRGRVTDFATGKPLIGANVQVDGTRLGAATSNQGYFVIDRVPEGEYRLVVRMIGYKVKIVRKVLVRAGRDTRVNVALESRPVELETVTVTGMREKEMSEQLNTSIRNLKTRDIVRMAGGGEDLFRSVQALPGVVARSDYSSQFYVRGGTPDQNLIIVDDVIVFNPYRLKMFGGPLSMFNPDMVDRVELLPGGFPAEYGDKLSAVLVTYNKEGDRFDHHAKSSLSLIDMKAVAEGPLPSTENNGSWIVSARRTYYDLLFNQLDELPKGTILPFFRDYQGKVVYDLAPTQKLRLNFSESIERMELKELDVEDDEDQFFKEVDEFNLSYGINNRLYSAGWINAISDVTLSTLTLSRFNDTWSFNLRADDQYYHPEIDMRKLEIREDVTSYLSPRNTLRFGLYIADYISDITVKISQDSASYYAENPDDRREDDGEFVKRNIRLQNASTSTAFYIQDEWKVRPPIFNVQAGLRTDHSTFTEEWVYSPRFSCTWLLTPDLVLRGGWGFFYQAPNFVSLFERFERELEWNLFETITLKNEKSIHYLAGVEWQPDPEYTVKLETYYKNLMQLVVPTDSTSAYVPNNKGEGYAWGFETFLEKRPSSESRLSGWISYSYSETRESDPNVKLHYRDFDQPHSISVVTRLKLFDRIHVDSKYIFGSGFPWTPVRKDHDGNPMFDENGEVVWGKTNSERYPYYSRWDIRLNWNRKFASKYRLMVYLEVINLLNRKNVYEYYWSGDYRTRYISYMLPRIPFFGIRLEL